MEKGESEDKIKSPFYYNIVNIIQNQYQENTWISIRWGLENRKRKSESSLKGRSARNKKKQGKHIQTTQTIQIISSNWIRISSIENGQP